ncbi:MAG: MopE-related protein [Nannocystaceae bacterium]
MDGHGVEPPVDAQICPDDEPLPGTAKEPDDCDDGNKEIHPGALELSDKVDNDCNGLIDEGSDGVADLFFGGCKRTALDGHFYWVCPEPTNPSLANERCKTFAVPESGAAAYHAKIESMEEHEQVTPLLMGDTSFGLKEVTFKGAYQWVADGSPLIGFGMGGFGMYPWLPGQPDNDPEDWIVLKFQGGYWGWNDAFETARAFLCEGVPNK